MLNLEEINTGILFSAIFHSILMPNMANWGFRVAGNSFLTKKKYRALIGKGLLNDRSQPTITVLIGL